uniref:chaperone protein dnaJ 20, chloroplastic-like n=1 Tax=Erigeron canadensis TaxID=72917 RepID=UPI001CB8A3F0|nr:chaperone protein dnaJ 20, chloroplastic-like [Erigeron canadensis]
MMHSSTSISSKIQTQFTLPSNSYKHSFISIPSPDISINLLHNNNRVKNPLLSINKNSKLVPKAVSTASSTLYKPIIEETLYDLLGISESVSLSEIKQAYKQMALKYHPDVSPPDRVDEYTMRFIKVQEAYETLSDPEARAMYDSSISKGLHLAFSGNKGSRFEARSEEKARWRESWEMQVEELQRKSTVGRGRKMSWAARIREQRRETGDHGSDPEQ